MKARISHRCRVLALGLALFLPHGLVPAGTPKVRCEGSTRPETLDLERWHGKVVLLDFWASWCGPCRESFPWMQRMLDQYSNDGLVVVAVNVDEDKGAAAAFLEGQPSGFDLVFDPDGCLPERLGVDTMPTSFLLDREGRVAFRHAGFRPEERENYEKDIRAVLSGEIAGVEDVADLAEGSPEPKLGVHPWERYVLALEEMRIGSDALDLALDDHIYFSKEASSGGRGFGGGGCGCN